MKLKKAHNLFLISTFFILLTFACKKNNTNHPSNNNDSLKTHNQTLQTGLKYFKNPSDTAYAFQFIESLIKDEYYVTALYHLKDMPESFKAHPKYHKFYFIAAENGYLFEELLSVDTAKVPNRFYTAFFIHKIDSINSISKQISSNTTASELYLKRAQLFMAINYWRAAFLDYKKAFLLDTTSYTAFYKAIYSNYLQQNNTLALDFLQKYNNKLQLSDKEQKTISSIKKVLQALLEIEQNKQLKPEQKQLQKAKIYARLGDNMMTHRALDKSIEFNDNFADAYAFKAFIFHKNGNKKKAIEYIEKAEKISGNFNSPLSKTIRKQ